MPYDLFISYSRRDNEQGRITQLVERIKTDFAPFAKRELVPFFDQQEIYGMQDWKQRILQGLRESRLLLACLSPTFLKSEWCEREFVEYLKSVIRLDRFGLLGFTPDHAPKERPSTAPHLLELRTRRQRRTRRTDQIGLREARTRGLVRSEQDQVWR